MSRTRSSALALGLLLAGGCATRDVETHPFHLGVTLPDGSSLSTLSDHATIVQLSGTGQIDSASRLILKDAQWVRQDGQQPLGDVLFSFDQTAAPLVAFPERLGGQALTIEVGLLPGGTGPALEPLDITGYRIATGGAVLPTYEFLIGEGTVANGSGLAQTPAPLYFLTGSEDIPTLVIAQDLLDYEPARCGLVYLDVLLVGDPGSTSVAALRRGAVHLVAVGPRPDPWIVLHVLSWHRLGACNGQASVWTQLAAWR